MQNWLLKATIELYYSIIIYYFLFRYQKRRYSIRTEKQTLITIYSWMHDDSLLNKNVWIKNK